MLSLTKSTFQSLIILRVRHTSSAAGGTARQGWDTEIGVLHFHYVHLSALVWRSHSAPASQNDQANCVTQRQLYGTVRNRTVYRTVTAARGREANAWSPFLPISPAEAQRPYRLPVSAVGTADAVLQASELIVRIDTSHRLLTWFRERIR